MCDARHKIVRLCLDTLTLRPWREVIAQSGLAATASRWCPLCLAEDRDSGRTPYLRLAWDVGAVTVCAHHRIRLVHVCPDCGRTDGRHSASCVVPGWCAHYGAFLGNVDPLTSATPEEMWEAAQVGSMLATQATLDSPPVATALRDTINELVTRLDNGKSAVFARRTGLGKATVHHRLREGVCQPRQHCCVLRRRLGCRSRICSPGTSLTGRRQASRFCNWCCCFQSVSGAHYRGCTTGSRFARN